MIRRSIQALVGIVLVIGLVFKFMHYPGAAALLGSAILGMAVLLLDRIIQHRAPKLMSRHNISCMLGIIYLLAVAFKVFHLPGAGIMLMTSMVGLTIVLIQFAFSIRSSKYAILPAYIQSRYCLPYSESCRGLRFLMCFMARILFLPSPYPFCFFREVRNSKKHMDH